MSKNEKDWKKFKEDHFQEDEDLKEDEDEHKEPQEPALDHASYAELEDKLTLAEQEAFKQKEMAMRLTAELDNVRRRAEQEVSKAHRYGLEQIIKSLLPVLDSLEQALQLAIKAGDEHMREGLELTMKLFLDVLQKHDVTQIDPINMPFDPHEHEAMSMQEQADTPANTVLVVFQKGYKLNDRVIRPARVIVSKS